MRDLRYHVQLTLRRTARLTQKRRGLMAAREWLNKTHYWQAVKEIDRLISANDQRFQRYFSLLEMRRQCRCPEHEHQQHLGETLIFPNVPVAQEC